MSAAAPLRLVGFRAELDGAILWDLVQMECQARSRLVVQVKGEAGEGEAGIGFLYFADGRIVHAVTGDRAGEAAALEILGWTRGSFHPCQRAWPAAPSIDTPCEALILEVARRRDDEGASNLVAFPVRADADIDADADIEIEDVIEGEGAGAGGGALHEKGMANMRSPNNVVPGTLGGFPPAPAVDSGRHAETPSLATPLGRGELTAEFPVVLRIGRSGAVLKNKGATEEMAGVVAYAHRLVQLAGELLGLEDLAAIECQFTEGRCLIFTEENGDLVALRPRPDTSLQGLRERLGL